MGDVKVPDTNHLTIAGRLTRDPDLRYSEAGKPWCSFGIANSRKWGGKEETAFVNCVCFGQVAEYVGEHIRKGRPVIVEGRIQTNAKEGEQPRTSVAAMSVTALDWEENHKTGTAAPKQKAAPTEEAQDDIPF